MKRPVLGVTLAPRVLMWFGAIALVLALREAAWADGAAMGYSKIKPVMVKIWILDRSKREPISGTGIVVASTGSYSYVLTSGHVVAAAKGPQTTIVTDLDNSVHSLPTVVYKQGGYDLALLRIERGNLSVASLSPRTPRVGDQVALVGFPGLQDKGTVETLRLTLGPVSSYQHNNQLLEISNADIEEGMSGGAIIDPTDGSVLGIIESRRGNAPGGYAVSAPNAVVSFLQENGVAVKMGSATPPAEETATLRPLPASNAQQQEMQEAFFAENYPTAAALAGDYLLSHPDDNLANGVMVSTIRALFLTKLEPQAAQAAKQYLVSHPLDPMANTVFAASLRQTAPEDAIQIFGKVAAIPYEFRPYVVEAYYNAAVRLKDKGDITGAVARLQAASAYGSSPEVRELLHQLRPDGISASSDVPAVQRSLQEFSSQIAEKLSAGLRDEAAALARQAHELYPADGSIPYSVFLSCINHAKSLESVGKWRAAIDELEQDAKELEPVSVSYAIRLYVSAGDILMPNEVKKTDLDEAVSIRDRVLALDPKNGLANLYAALLERYHLHDLESAKRHLLIAAENSATGNEANKDILEQQLHELGLAH